MDEQKLERKIIKSLKEGYTSQEVITALEQDGYRTDEIRKLMNRVKEDLNNKHKKPKELRETNTAQKQLKQTKQTTERQGKERKPVVVLSLTFLTFGIYFLYWEYQAIKQILHGKESSNLTWYLLTWIPLVNLVVYWKICGEIEEYSEGEHSQTMLIILWIILPPIGLYITQKDLNKGLKSK